MAIEDQNFNLQNAPTRELTLGEKLVGLEFNPSGRQDVNEVKQLCANLADIVNGACIPTTEQYLQNTFK